MYILQGGGSGLFAYKSLCYDNSTPGTPLLACRSCKGFRVHTKLREPILCLHKALSIFAARVYSQYYHLQNIYTTSNFV